ncbi:scavenger receptor class F member 2-like isoform X2 [Liolophura sinensis]|uniref:scavenger receptor class F member 2-like isoform X2 n=1 Tax=Liolophura sinensis TaxID=3198878 RepID=UPI003158C1CC
MHSRGENQVFISQAWGVRRPFSASSLFFCRHAGMRMKVCTSGTYGPDCKKRCGNCTAGSLVCNTTSGHCPQTLSICIPGFSPPTCETNCNPGTYGSDCKRKCGHCSEGESVCDVTIGHCPDRKPRCSPGYSGVACDTVCTSGTYGPDCKKRCGNCTAGSLVCNTTSGHCPQTLSICIPGFSPPTCETNCNPGTYGSDCKRKCGHCSEGESVCDVTIGHCPDRKPRCSPGYSGVACDTECRNNTWGKDCQEKCGNCYDKTECNAVTGECPVATGNPRCDLGYTGTDCVKVSDLTDTSKDYTGVIAGSAVGISLVVLVTGLIIIVMVRRITTRVQTGGAKGSGPNSTPAEESSVPAEVMNRSEMSEPASLYNTRDENSGEDPPYEAIREYVNL